MKQIHINLLDVSVASSYPSATPYQYTQPRRSWTAKILITLFGIGILTTGASVFSYQNSQHDQSANTLGKLNLFGTLLNFSEHADKPLSGEREGRINILLLGIGGAGHEGSNLTDTIMIASIDPKNNKVALISLPRDLLVDIPGYGWNKINNAHAYGEAERSGHGPELLAQVVSSTFHMPINYYVRLDFKGFEKAVDLVGGVTVVVDNAFTDYTYPTSDKKYQIVHFDEGPQLLDGVRALQYARSRHSLQNNEGSDFARSKRQQKVIMAMREKLLTKDFLLNPQHISDLLSTLNDNISTNLEGWELIKLAQFAKSIQSSDLTTVVFDDGPDNYLHSEITSEGAYVLRPNDGTFDAMSQEINTIFNTIPGDQQNSNPTATIIVKNGTQVTGLATKVADQLKTQGFAVSAVGNALDRAMTKTVIYDFTNGTKDDALSTLSTALKAKVVQGTSPETDANNAHVDFLVILGVSQPVTQIQ